MFTDKWRQLETLITAAPTNPEAEKTLRRIVELTATKAPLEAVIEIGRLLVEIRKRDMKSQDETN